MLWIKSFHIISVVCWFAAIFYLPRLFVYHAQSTDGISIERFKIMERKLYNGIMTPSAIATIASGLWLWSYGFAGVWLHLKLFLVALLVVYHVWCGYTLRKFADDRNHRSHVYYRVMNEVPVLLLVGIVILVVVKPF